jgi:hypothetical protein
MGQTGPTGKHGREQSKEQRSFPMLLSPIAKLSDPFSRCQEYCHISVTNIVLNSCFQGENFGSRAYSGIAGSAAPRQCILWDPSDRPQHTAAKFGGESGYIASSIKNQDRLLWFCNRYSNKNQIDIEELMHLATEARKKMMITHDYRKRYTPGFENSFIVLICPQLGCRGSRRMHGEYFLTLKEMGPMLHSLIPSRYF